MIDITPEREACFWDSVDRSGECWFWRGMKDGNGYGQFSIDERRFGAHRVAWCLEKRVDLPSHHQIRHKCGNRLCVRPSHLKMVSKKSPTEVKLLDNSYTLTLHPRKRKVEIEPVPQRVETPHKPRVPRWRDFQDYVREMADVHTTLSASVRATEHLNQSIVAINNKFKAQDSALQAKVERLETYVFGLHSKIDQAVELLLMIRALSEPEPKTGDDDATIDDDSEPEAEPSLPSSPESEPSEPTLELKLDPEPETSEPSRSPDLDNTLRSVFCTVTGVDEQTLNEESLRCLETVFDVAMLQHGNLIEPAVQRFAIWLDEYVASCKRTDGAEVSADGFSRYALSREDV